MVAAIYKRLKDEPKGDCVMGDVFAAAGYIAERTGLSSHEVLRRLERGETVETCFALYRPADRCGNLIGKFE